MAKKILLFGAAGQLGQALQFALRPEEWTIIPSRRSDCDLTDAEAVNRTIMKHKPELVINCAAMTNVDQCEKEQEAAREANFITPAHIAHACSVIDAPLIHLSTDYVFDGEKETPYQETDELRVVNHYGFTKMLGEDAVRETLPWHIILRVSWVFSAYGDNVLHRIIKTLTTQEEARMVSDQTTRPTYAPAAAEAILTMAKRAMDLDASCFGTFHYCGAPTTSRYNFALQVRDILKQAGHKVARLEPCQSSDFPSPAKRPMHTALDCSKIERVYGIPQQAWNQHLESAVLKVIGAKQ